MNQWQVYPRSLATLPDVLVIDVPDRFAHPGLPFSRYWPIPVEGDLGELAAFSSPPRAMRPVPADLLDRRPGNLAARRITFAANVPPARGRSHPLVCHWPPFYVDLATAPDMFARRACTTGTFETSGELSEACARLLDIPGRRDRCRAHDDATGGRAWGSARSPRRSGAGLPGPRCWYRMVARGRMGFAGWRGWSAS